MSYAHAPLTLPGARRSSWIAALSALLVLAPSLALPGGAAAAVASPATLSMGSDAGDYIGQGQRYAYSTASGDAFSMAGNPNHVRIALDGANGDWWYLDFAAPGGADLAAATSYGGATRYPFQDPSAPGLSVSGNGRGCNTLFGGFDVHELAYGADGVLTRLRATFEQHCEGAQPALRGTIDIGDPAPPRPPPPPLEIGATVDAAGSVNRRTGEATVSGTVTCSAAARATVSGTVTQAIKRWMIASGSFSVAADCSPKPTPWRATASSKGAVAFGPGAADVAIAARAIDPSSGTEVSAGVSATVQLRR